jgi:hypothetical protein
MTLFWAQPAEAATAANATIVASGSLGSRREVAWFSPQGVLYLQRLKTDGSPAGPPIEVDRSSVSDPEREYELGGPLTVAVGGTGTMVAASYNFHSPESTRHSPIGFFVDREGKLVGGFSLCGTDDQLNGPAGFQPGAAAWNGSLFMLAGTCERNDGQGPFLRNITYDPVTGEFAAFDPGLPAAATSISVTSLGAGFAVAWQESGATGDYDIFALVFNPAGQPAREPVTVASGPGHQTQPTIAGSGRNYLVAWVEGANGSRDVAGRLVLPPGFLGGPKTKLISAPGNQNHPGLAPSSKAGWHLAWADLRSGNNDVFSANVSFDLGDFTLGVSPVNGQVVAGGSGAQNAPTVSPLPNGRGYVAFLDRGIARIRNLTPASAPTGEVKTVSFAPK